jgi:hypothetical protein
LPCDAVVLDEYGAVMASSTRDKRLLSVVSEQWQDLPGPARRGTHAITTEHGTVEIQTLQGRSAVVGWLAVRLRGPEEPAARLLLNHAAGLITLQLDWPA